MKRLICACAVLAFPLLAHASPELATEWGSEASDLHAETTVMLTVIDIGDRPDLKLDYLIKVQRFTSTARKLGKWIDTSKGARDLGCIFRGMAEEGELQLAALDTTPDTPSTRAALARLATMFSDAEVIAIASSHRTKAPALPRSAQVHTCPASSKLAQNALR